ncbi:hypothetical protein PACTADRAFT_21134, partial [Pachysolen tannophilus NRRL Y-2460]
SNSSSLFGNITKSTFERKAEPERNVSLNVNSAETGVDHGVDRGSSDETTTIEYVDPKDDGKLQEFLHKKPVVAIDKLLSPLKKKIYLKNVGKNGFFKNNDEVILEDNTKYRLRLTYDEIEALEPSIYLKSYRIKSSMKKAMVMLRLLRHNMELKTAITQCQFMNNKKKIAHEVYNLLSRGLEQSEKLGYQGSKLYISQIWTGSDGYWSKRIECKGRGRNGLIRHRYVHIKCIVKTDQTLKRLAYEKEQKLKKKIEDGSKIDNMSLKNQPIRSQPSGFYKW